MPYYISGHISGAPTVQNRETAMAYADAYFSATHPGGSVQYFANQGYGYWAFLRAQWLWHQGEWLTYYNYPSSSYAYNPGGPGASPPPSGGGSSGGAQPASGGAYAMPPSGGGYAQMPPPPPPPPVAPPPPPPPMGPPVEVPPPVAPGYEGGGSISANEFGRQHPVTSRPAASADQGGDHEYPSLAAGTRVSVDPSLSGLHAASSRAGSAAFVPVHPQDQMPPEEPPTYNRPPAISRPPYNAPSQPAEDHSTHVPGVSFIDPITGRPHGAGQTGAPEVPESPVMWGNFSPPTFLASIVPPGPEGVGDRPLGSGLFAMAQDFPNGSTDVPPAAIAEETSCTCSSISLTTVNSTGAEVKRDPGESGVLELDIDADETIRLTITPSGSTGSYSAEVIIYCLNSRTRKSLKFVSTEAKENSDKDALKKTRKEMDKWKDGRKEVVDRNACRVLFAREACRNSLVVDMVLDKAPAGVPDVSKAQRRDSILVYVVFNHKKCGERRARIGREAVISASEVEFVDVAADKAIADALKKFALRRIETEDCPKCPAIATGDIEAINSEPWANDLAKFKSRVRELVEEGDMPPSSNDTYVLKVAKPSSIVGGYKKEDGVLNVYVGMKLDENDNGDVSVSPTWLATLRCPPMVIAIAIANNGHQPPAGSSASEAATHTKGGNATAVVQYTGFAFASAGNGYSFWSMSPEDTKVFSDRNGNPNDGLAGGGNFKGPSPEKSVILEMRQTGGVGGAAAATGGTSFAMAGDGGNGVSGGNGGNASVTDATAPNCCAGNLVGQANGGFGGHGCNGNGGNGGNATASSNGQTRNGQPCQTYKTVFAGHGGIGIGTGAGKGTGGRGGSTKINNGAPNQGTGARDPAGSTVTKGGVAIGGCGGYGTNRGGAGGDVEWAPADAGSDSVGNPGSGGNSNGGRGTEGQKGARIPGRGKIDGTIGRPKEGASGSPKGLEAYACT